MLAPDEIFVPVEDLFSRLAAYPRVRLRRGDEGGDGATVEFATQAPPALPIDGRATRPIGFLQDFLAAHTGRCLVVAETPGRREILLETLDAHGLRPALVESWSDFLAGRRRARDDRRRARGRRVHRYAVRRGHHGIAALRGARRPAPPASWRWTRPRGAGARPRRAPGRGAGGARGAWRGTLRGSGAAGHRRRERGVPPDRLRRRGQALRAGGLAAPRLALYRHGSGGRAAAQARQPPVAAGPAPRRGAGRRRGGGAARGAGAAGEPAGDRVRRRVRVPPRLRGGLPVRGDAGSGRRDPAGRRRHAPRRADGPPGVRRRRIRQDRGRDARGVHRGAVRKAGGGARPHDPARPAAPPDVQRPVRGLAGADRAALALSRPRRPGRGRARPRRRRRGHRHRHPQAARRRHPVQASGAGGDRRGAPLRRAPEGAVSRRCGPRSTSSP